MTILSVRRVGCAALSAVLAAAVAPGQCELQWEGGNPVASPVGSVRAVLPWDPDGAGPLSSVLVAVGYFTFGNTTNQQLATWDGSAWQPFSPPTAGNLRAAVVYNGSLVVAGTGQIQRWTGAAWQTIGACAGGVGVLAMTVFGGELVIGGEFDTVSGVATANIARWNGSSWNPLGSGCYTASGSLDRVQTLASYTYGASPALYAGGKFDFAGGVSAKNCAVWNGTAWSGGFDTNGDVLAMAVRFSTSPSTSYLFLGGAFTTVGGVAADRVARYSSTAGALLALGGLGGSQPCRKLFVRAAGASSFELIASQDSQLWRWTGTVWNTLGPSLEQVVGYYAPSTLAPKVEAIAWYAGRYVVGLADYYGLTGGTREFDGTTWLRLHGAGIDDRVNAVLPLGAATLIGGRFRNISGVPMHGVATGSPGNWQPLGSGLVGSQGEVLALARLANGDLVAGGTFSQASGGAADHVARWDGAAWVPLGAGLNGRVNALCVLPNGDLVAGGAFTLSGIAPTPRIARWNGSTWSAVGGGLDGEVLTLGAMPNGDLVAGGLFGATVSPVLAVPRVARFDGVAWQPMGVGMDGAVRGFAIGPTGTVFACGDFDTAGGQPAEGIARWDGSVWLPMPPGLTNVSSLRAVVALPNGDVVVGGELFSIPGTGGFSVRDLLTRLRGTTWERTFCGTEVFGATVESVRALALREDGSIAVGGALVRTGAIASGNFAGLVSPCPASASPYGAGCAGAGGVDTLVPTALPWIGSSYRARGSGLPPLGICGSIHGFAPASVPLSASLPQALLGCTLSVTLDLVDVQVAAGVVATTTAIPFSPGLVGQSLYHQLVTIELAPSGQFVAVTASNALALTIGSL